MSNYFCRKTASIEVADQSQSPGRILQIAVLKNFANFILNNGAGDYSSIMLQAIRPYRFFLEYLRATASSRCSPEELFSKILKNSQEDTFEEFIIIFNKLF